MIFALLTLLSALSLAAVAGWFSIVGFMAIYAGAPMYALIMGVVTECAKLVTTSWLYRNWGHTDWKLKIPLIYFTLALMTATSIGVFGFLSKAHLEQGAGTIDNSARIEQLQYQIDREKATIADNEKVTKQLDDTVNSLLGKDRADRALSVRKSQASQRAQLRIDSAEAQKRIDGLNAEKFKLESEVRKMQLDVGPIRYISELFYGVDENATKNIEAAVRIFTLLLVSTLDPLAVILLIAANHTLIRLRNEKKEEIPSQFTPRFFDRFRRPDKSVKDDNKVSFADETENNALSEPVIDLRNVSPPNNGRKEIGVADPVLQENVVVLDEEKIVNQRPPDSTQSQTKDVSEGEIVIANGASISSTEAVEDLGRSEADNTALQASIGSTELQTQISAIGALLNEEQESSSAQSEEIKEPFQEPYIEVRGPTDVYEFINKDVQASIENETMDQTETADRSTENIENSPSIQIEDEKETTILENFTPPVTVRSDLPVVRTPILSRIENESEDILSSPLQSLSVNRVPWAQQDTVLRELLGNVPHFSPQRLDEKEIVPGPSVQEGKGGKETEKTNIGETGETEIKTLYPEESNFVEETSSDPENRKISVRNASEDKYPKALSWLTEFRRL